MHYPLHVYVILCVYSCVLTDQYQDFEFFQDNDQERAIPKYSDVIGGKFVRMYYVYGIITVNARGLGVYSYREIFCFRPILWYLRLFWPL